MFGVLVAYILQRLHHSGKFRAPRWLLYLFSACLGFPGEGPTPDPAESDEGSSATRLQFQTMSNVYRQAVERAASAPGETRKKLARLQRLGTVVPCMFVIFMAWSCCFSTVGVDMCTVYREAVHVATLDHAPAKNYNLANLAGAFRDGEFLPCTFQGQSVCDDCFKGLYNVSDSDFQRMKTDVRKGKVFYEHGNCGSSHGYTGAGATTRAWLERHVASVGDFQPDTGQIHLSPMHLKDLHAQAAIEVGAENILDYSTFCRMFNNDFKDVRIPAQKRLGKCETCNDIHEAICAERDPLVREGHKAQQRQHTKFYKGERIVYHSNRLDARENPGTSMSIIIDGVSLLRMLCVSAKWGLTCVHVCVHVCVC